MPVTTIETSQIRTQAVQRSDLNTSTVGQAVVAKLLQGANISLSSTGADAGTGDVTIAATVSTGPQGPAGANSFTVTSGSFTVPASGSTTTVAVADASWIVPGQVIYVDTAGGGAGLAGALIVQSKAGNTLTLLTP